MNNGFKLETPCELLFVWYNKDKRIDADNQSFAQKFILDGMQKAGLIANDNQKNIIGLHHQFRVDKSCPRVEITIWKAEELK